MLYVHKIYFNSILRGATAMKAIILTESNKYLLAFICNMVITRHGLGHRND